MSEAIDPLSVFTRLVFHVEQQERGPIPLIASEGNATIMQLKTLQARAKQRSAKGEAPQNQVQQQNSATEQSVAQRRKHVYMLDFIIFYAFATLPPRACDGSLLAPL